ncbi:MAG: hypothetical protein JW953_08290 [Anaerolineae bacterium]|nr:hypothetical protein [Anaerolineae bacterium]
MEKRFSSVVGVSLILLGALALVVNIILPSVGINFWTWTVGRLWPLIVIGLGWLLVLIPVLVRGWRGLGGLLIPGLPILTTGTILLGTSFFNWWHLWAWLWPLEVISVALGFLFAAIYIGSIWLIVPAVIIGLNGLVLQFCALTGLWESWSVLWTVEPLAVGLALVAVALFKRRAGLFVAGLILCGLAGAGFLTMTGILAATVSWPWLGLVELVAPLILILVGMLLVAWNVAHRPRTSNLF